MPKKEEKSKVSFLHEFLSSPWKTAITATTTFVAVLGIGYKYGEFNKELDCKMEKIEMKQDFNDKIQKATDECKEFKLQQYKESVDNLEKLVKELQEKKDDK